MGERRAVVLIGGAIALCVGLAFLWILAPSAQNTRTLSRAGLNDITDTAQIQKHVELSRISIATSENYVGHRIRLISGVLKNISDKPLRAIDVKLVFTDFDEKPIQENLHEAFEVSRRPLEPGEQFRFEVGFENLPRTWNYRVPLVDVVRVSY
jgi:hypothetical protein